MVPPSPSMGRSNSWHNHQVLLGESFQLILWSVQHFSAHSAAQGAAHSEEAVQRQHFNTTSSNSCLSACHTSFHRIWYDIYWWNVYTENFTNWYDVFLTNFSTTQGSRWSCGDCGETGQGRGAGGDPGSAQSAAEVSQVNIYRRPFMRTLSTNLSRNSDCEKGFVECLLCSSGCHFSTCPSRIRQIE